MVLNIENTDWKERYIKNKKPPKSALLDFWTNETRKIFEDFSNTLHDKYSLNLTHLTYTVTYGWKFKYSLKNIELVKNVYILNDGFCIDHIVVRNSCDYQNALDYVATLYTEDFLKQYNEKIIERNQKQKERSKRHSEREKKIKSDFINQIDSQKLNKFIWSPRISQIKLKQLYASDAKQIYNDELVDEVGFTLYARCLQGRDERILAREGKLKCHHCNEINISLTNGLIVCSCGYAYIFREYMRSFHREGMPSRSATPFFNEFINKWSIAKNYHNKMQAIDYVIHEMHLNMFSGVTRGFAGKNLIEGTSEQCRDLILSLAYK